MPWSTTSDVRAFAERALDHLATDPVAHTALLTEVAHLLRHPEPGAPQRYAWWTEDGGSATEVTGAVVQAPRHAPIAGRSSTAALSALPSVLTDAEVIGVDAREAEAALDAWAAAGRPLTVRARFAALRLMRPGPPGPPATVPGTARVAGGGDLELLTRWFDAFRAAQPDDPSDRSFVVDDPLAAGAIVLWEVDGEPVAMSSRTPVVGGMTRMGLTFSPTGDDELERTVLAAGCAAAAAAAPTVLALTPTEHGSVDRFSGLGFDVVGERVLLGPAG